MGSASRTPSFDLIVSNCVINLARDKEAVLRQARRVLKEGRRAVFSDVYADRRVPRNCATTPCCCTESALAARCIGTISCGSPRRRVSPTRDSSNPRCCLSTPGPSGSAPATSASTRRPTACSSSRGLETACEDYGQAIGYKGTVPDAPESFLLDGHHRFESGRVMTVCGNTALMLAKSRFGRSLRLLRRHDEALRNLPRLRNEHALLGGSEERRCLLLSGLTPRPRRRARPAPRCRPPL